MGVHGVGVYLSTDAGSTWSFVGGGATMPIRSAFDSEGTLYVRYRPRYNFHVVINYFFNCSFHDQAVMKLQKTKWQDITPMRGISYRLTNLTYLFIIFILIYYNQWDSSKSS